MTSLVSTQPLQPQFNQSHETNASNTDVADPEIRNYSETDESRGNTEQGLTAENRMSLPINDKAGDTGSDDAMLNNEPRITEKDFKGRDERNGSETTNQPEENDSLSLHHVTGSVDGERTVLNNESDVPISTAWSEKEENFSLTSHRVIGSSVGERTVLNNESDVSISTAWSQEEENVSLTSYHVTGSIDGERTVLNKESDVEISTVWSEDIISRGSITEYGESDGGSSTSISRLTASTTVEEKSNLLNETSTELNSTNDGGSLIKDIEAAAYNLYVGAGVVFGLSVLVTMVAGLTVWRRRRRALRRELQLKRNSQRSQIPQMEKLYSMAAFVAATDGADHSTGTVTRTATVGRRHPGPRTAAVTAASTPLLQNTNTEDLAQIRKEMFGDVRTWAPERRVSNPPSRNFFK